MDFELDDDQHALQEVVHDLVEGECPPSLVRAVVESRDDGNAFWKALVEGDWPGLTVPEADGGTGAGPVELVIAIEELGRGGDPTPFLATTSQYVPLVRACTGLGDRSALLAEIAAGGTGAAAFGPDSVTAQRQGDGWVLAGTATEVLDGDRADEAAVVATTDDGLGVFVVPADAVRPERQTTFDRSFHLATIAFDGVEVPAGRAAVGPDVAAAVERARHEAVTGLAATMVGACQRVLELTLVHIQARHQFGVPIGSFQAVKHLAVDAFIAIQRARALCQYAALTLAEDDLGAAVAASMAKAAAGDCQRLVSKNGIQLFGGLGYTWENDLQLFVRRAKVCEPLLGKSSAHRQTVGRLTFAAEHGVEVSA
jgi:alkylation response protein AidB-like acyl-CoA dehydrogenase